MLRSLLLPCSTVDCVFLVFFFYVSIETILWLLLLPLVALQYDSRHLFFEGGFQSVPGRIP